MKGIGDCADVGSTASLVKGRPLSTPTTSTSPVDRAVTCLLVVGPAVALALMIPLLWGHAVHLRDLVIGLILYGVTGHGVTVGFHRLLTHRSFKAKRPLKIALTVAGSMALEGSVVSWVANHRRHHTFSDRDGDPHSPHRYGDGPMAQARGFLHAHVGWLFASNPASAERFAPDLLADRDIVLIGQLFPLLALTSLAIPFGLGWLLGGTVSSGLTALLWGGIARMALLHHVTWSVNSVCHVFGRRPFTTKDRSTNFAPLAVLSFGESWHNLHHAFPSSARHGALRGQVDSSARLIRVFEQIGWATKVRWPTVDRLEARTAA